ncbi:MAG: TonB-dependent receptor [Bacteroidales bacterium]|nr:TonB-dependent receptor [Bacteroidales bacterium]
MKELKRITAVLSLCLLCSVALSAQNNGNKVSFTVYDESSRPVEMAAVVLNQALYAITDAAGTCTISGLHSGRYVYTVSLLGYETVTDTIVVNSANISCKVVLRESNLSLESAVVTARQDQVGSRSVINQDAIRHIQPKNLGDMLQLVPGNLVTSPNLNSLSQATIREIDVNGDNNYAVGTSVIVDGTPLSNDGNLQVLNANRYGSSADGNNQTVGENTTGGKGTDLRLVSGQNIESMEVIRGIPAAEYGNLTTGAVIVKTKSGHTPWEFKAQADPNSKMLFLGKGFNLKTGGATNFSVDWAQSWADTRLHYKGYDRITASAGYSNQFGPVSFNLRAAFYTSINNTKRDPQMTESHAEWKNSNTGGRLGINGSWRPRSGFITSLDYKLSGQLSRQHDWKSQWIYNPDGVITNTREAGLAPANFKRFGYQSEYEIESIPLNVFAQLVASKYIQFGDENHTNLKVGAEFSYDGNMGKGLTYDEENPPQAQSSHTLRPRAYSDIPGLSSVSAFISDRTSFSIGSHKAMAEAGVRVSKLFLDSSKSGGNSGYFAAEPRMNLSFNILNRKNNRLLDDLTVNGGFGLMNKMPTLIYLYPDKAYYDNVAIGRWSDNEQDRLALVTTTVIENTQNPELKPMHSRKWEAGFSFAKGRVKGSLTYFNEKHTNGFGFESRILDIRYPYYTVPDGAKNLTFDAADKQVGYTIAGVPGTASKTEYLERVSWSIPSNTYDSYKSGIEYTLDLGEWKPIRTSLNVTGAWFHIKRLSTNVGYSNVNIDTRLSYTNFYMVKQAPGKGSVRDRVNTNFAFITHIPAVRLVFTTTVQVVWMESEYDIYEDEAGNSRYYSKSFPDGDYICADPLGYYDIDGNWYEWTPAAADNKLLYIYMNRVKDYDLAKDVIEPWAMLNFRLTKEIGKVADLSFIANNVTNTRKYHTNKHSLYLTQIYPPMYFGAEVKIKL